MSQINFTPSDSRDARQVLNLSQANAAAGAGINRVYLSQFENGSRILDDEKLNNLREFYLSEGWKQEEHSPQEEVEKFERNYKIIDGFVIPEGTDYEEAEELLSEYQDNLNEIRELKGRSTVRGKLFGGFYREDTHEKCSRLFYLMARNWSIIAEIQGQDAYPPCNLPDKNIETLGDYIQDYFWLGQVGQRGKPIPIR